jgi:hypothetical protein
MKVRFKMHKNSESLWLDVATVSHTGGQYKPLFRVKLSGMADIKGFLEAFLPAETEAMLQRSSLAYAHLEFTMGFQVEDGNANTSIGGIPKVTIKRFLDDYWW